jgi:sugar diacid utilization regulator
MMVGKQRMPESRCYFYQDLIHAEAELPILFHPGDKLLDAPDVIVCVPAAKAVQRRFARSYRTARTTMMVGKQRMPESRCYFYQDLMLPVHSRDR